MPADPLTDAVSTRICKHMNDDHAEAVLAYAKHYGGVSNPAAARMVSVKAETMELEATVRTHVNSKPCQWGRRAYCCPKKLKRVQVLHS